MSYNPSFENPNTKNNHSQPVGNEHTLLINIRYEGSYKKEIFENLGFKFQDFSDEIIDLVCKNGNRNPKNYDCRLHPFTQVVLPDGWRMEVRNSKLYEHFFLIDQNNHKRGEYFGWCGKPGHIGNHTGKIFFMPKFRTAYHFTGEACLSPTLISVKDSDDKIIYTAGTAYHLSDEYVKLVHQANDYLKNKYPECEEAYFTITFPNRNDYGTGFLYTKIDKYWD